MSRTSFIRYGEDGFWAYDVALGILLKHLIDVAEPLCAEDIWLRGRVDFWRVVAIPETDYRLDLSGWSDRDPGILRRLLEVSIVALEEKGSISSDEASAWDILDGEGVFLRGASEFPVKPVIELARAMIALLDGALDPSPMGMWWFYGLERGRDTIRRRVKD